MFTYLRSNKNTVLNAIEVMSWMTHDDNDTIHSSYNRAHGWSDDQHLYYSVVMSGGGGGGVQHNEPIIIFQLHTIP